MAEATLAVTFPAVGEGMTVDAVDRHALEHDRYAVPATDDATPESVRRLALLGRPLRGLRAAHRAIPHPARARGEREVGELELRGPSVTPGLLPQRGGHRGHVPTTAGCAPATSPTSSTASSWCAAG